MRMVTGCLRKIEEINIGETGDIHARCTVLGILKNKQLKYSYLVEGILTEVRRDSPIPEKKKIII